MNPLVDTNIISELMRPQPDKSVVAWASRQKGFSVSAVSLEELYFGLSRRHLPLKQQWLEEFLRENCQVLPVNAAIARTAGGLRGRLAAEGKVRSSFDILIAATALAHHIPVATRNTADFAGCGVEVINPFGNS